MSVKIFNDAHHRYSTIANQGFYHFARRMKKRRRRVARAAALDGIWNSSSEAVAGRSESTPATCTGSETKGETYSLGFFSPLLPLELLKLNFWDFWRWDEDDDDRTADIEKIELTAEMEWKTGGWSLAVGSSCLCLLGKEKEFGANLEWEKFCGSRLLHVDPPDFLGWEWTCDIWMSKKIVRIVLSRSKGQDKTASFHETFYGSFEILPNSTFRSPWATSYRLIL